MAVESGKLVRWTTFLLTALACVGIELGVGHPFQEVVWWPLGLGILAACLGLCLVRRQDDATAWPAVWAAWVQCGAFFGPIVCEPLRRSLTGDGSPWEILLIHGLRNLALALAACAAWPGCRRLAAGVSLFLMVFAAALADHPVVLPLLGLYAAVAAIWLMAAYWEKLDRSGFEIAQDLRTSPIGFPLSAMMAVVVLVGAVTAGAAVGPRRVLAVLAEWLPTSGGTGDYDPFARGGINDGDEEAPGEGARSTGFVETDHFLDSPLPSLYDMFNDTFGDSCIPRKIQRALALDSRTKVEIPERHPEENQRPNREFSAARKRPRQSRPAEKRRARALFEVQGRTPLHLRAVAYDRFDGTSWKESPLDDNLCRLAWNSQDRRFEVHRRPLQEARPQLEQHRFRMCRPEGSWLPAPPHLAAFRLGKVDRNDFFLWGPENILRLARREVPSGITLRTACEVLDPSLFGRSASWLPTAASPQDRKDQVPEHLLASLQARIRNWVGGRAEGWEAIRLVVEGLRRDFEFDPDRDTSSRPDAPLAEFLSVGRGPSHHFAGTAVLCLRSMGHTARLVGGFYVAPARYDAATDHTPVTGNDLHFWAEVLLPNGEWMVLEATPGYEVLGPRAPWYRALLDLLVGPGSWCRQHPGLLGLLAVMGIIAAKRRRWIMDRLGLWRWRWRWRHRDWRLCARAAWIVQERRCARAGRLRPAWSCPRLWVGATWNSLPTTGPDAGPVEDHLELAHLAEWAAYAPHMPDGWNEERIRRTCSRILDSWSTDRLRDWIEPSHGTKVGKGKT